MGHYTRLEFDAILAEGTPDWVIKTLEHMLTWRADQLAVVPDHPFFAKPRWACVGAGHGSQIAALAAGGHRVKFDCRFKNYDGEIEAFLNWIFPHMRKDPGHIVGNVKNDDQQTFDLPGALLVMKEGGIDIVTDASNDIEANGASDSTWP